MSDDKQPADDLDQNRPYPDGIAFDEAWRQRQRADSMEAVNADMYRIIKRFATVDWMGERELSMWVRECREIMRKIELETEKEDKQ